MRVICAACGCNLEPVPGVPLGVAACPDCGKPIDLRDHLPAKSTGEVTIEAEARIKAERSGPPQPLPSVGRHRRQVPWPMVGAGAALAAGVAVLVTLSTVRTVPTPPVERTAVVPWDQAHRAELLSMKRSADAAALGGNLRGAYDGYARMLAAAADHDVADPVVVQTLVAARAQQDRVFAAMLGNAGPAATAVAFAPTVPPPATRPVAPGISPMLFPQLPAASGPAIFGGPSTSAKPATSAAPATSPAPAAVPTDPMAAVDTAPAVAHPPPPPRLHAYTLAETVSDAEIGRAIDSGIRYLAGRFNDGEVVTGLADRGLVPGLTTVQPKQKKRAAGQANRPPAAGGVTPPALGGDVADATLSGGSDLGRLTGAETTTDMDGPSGTHSPRMPSGAPHVAPWASAFSTPGIDALCVYALMHAGQATATKGLGPGDPFTDAAIDRLKRYDLTFTYHRSLRAAALAVYNRPEDLAALEEDVGWLLAAARDGHYTYQMPTAAHVWDNSNSQYGLLGVWSGAQAGIDVPPEYWRAVERHWTACAGPAGTWGYGARGATLTMTCAGVASLLVARDYLDDNGLAATAADRPTRSRAADAGLAQLDVGDNCVNGLYHATGVGAMGGAGYGLYGLERAGLASGFKYFGNHDWYAELARTLVNEQRADGSWASSGTAAQTEIDTAYALLFLARGRHPILFNKLRYDGPWDDRPHDVAHLARFAAKQLERPLNWQVVNLRRDWFDWMDSPVLYVAGDAAPNMTDRDVAALRDFALGGGLIVTHADGGSPAFTAWVRRFVRRAFPKYELVTVAKADPLYSVLYKLKAPPPLTAVSNGSRLLLVHSPTDVAGGWQLNWTDERRADFSLGLNLFVYAAGKTDYQNRQSSTYIPPAPNNPDVVRTVARLRFAGEWDPEPYAWTRFARYFRWETRQGLDVPTVDLKSLVPGQVPMAVLSGTFRQDFTPAEAAAARAYVQAGGVLLVDACGGQPAFDRSVRTTLLPVAFPGVPLQPLTATHPLLVPSRAFADDLRAKLPLRPFAVDQLGTSTVPVEGLAFGRGWVIYSRLDLTSGLLGTQSWGILGYDAATAQALVKNAVLWAVARSEAERPRPTSVGH